MSADERRSMAIAGVAGLVVAILAGSIAAGGDVPGWEEAVFHAVNDLPDWLEAPMWVFQLAGLLFVPLGVAAVAAWRGRWATAIALVVFVPLKLLVEKGVVKQLVERERPATSICGAPDLEAGCIQLRGDVPLDGLSFVSGHAIIAWGVVTILWPVLPRWGRSAAVAVAVLNATARVYLGAHNPLDVIGGGAVGVAVGAAVVLVVDALWSRWGGRAHVEPPRS